MLPLPVFVMKKRNKTMHNKIAAIEKTTIFQPVTAIYVG